jgi:hypothetical protein
VGAVDTAPQLLQPPWNLYRPGGIAEMTSDRTNDRGYCERGEGNSATWIEAIYCVDQPEVAGLHYIVEWFASICVALGDVADQGHMHFNEFVTDPPAPIFARGWIPQRSEECVLDIAAICFQVHSHYSGLQ